MRRLVTVIIRLYKEVELNVRLLDSDALVEHVYVRLADVQTLVVILFAD